MASQLEYTRLPGRTSGFSRHSLWLGADHLLSVANRGGYSEDYKRFYYRDIRAILLRKTNTYAIVGAIFSVVVGIFFLLHILGFLLWKWEEAEHLVLAVFTSTFLFILLVHLLRGGTCAVNVFTAVHSEALPSLNRTRVAMKAIALLRARVEGVQGVLPREQLTGEPSLLSASQAQAPARTSEQREDYSGNFHSSLFALLLFNAVFTLVGCFFRNMPLHVANVFVYVALVLFLIGALIRQRKSRMRSGLRRLTWGSALYIWLVSVLNSFVAVYLLFQGGVKMGKYGYWDMMKAVFTTVPAEHLPLLILEIFLASGSLVLGATGFILLVQYKREHP